MKNQLHLSIVFLICISFLSSASGQETSKQDKNYKNTVRLNLTNPLIFGDRSLVVGYERTLGEHRSFSINLGQAELPEFGLFNPDEDNPDAQLTKNSKGSGFNMTADYRFYLGTENKFRAPRGVYIGPYAGYVTMGRKNTWTLDTDNTHGDVITDFNLSILALGAELGYQFVLWKRVALDFVLIGPGLAGYSLEAKLDTTLDPDDEALLFQKISEALTEKFPGYSFAIDDAEFKKTGSSNVTSLGFRYVINLGFRF